MRAGDLGENITTAGLDLERMPLDTVLQIGTSAAIGLTGLRTPCLLIDRFQAGLKRRLVLDSSREVFRAGVMATVLESGEVSPGDSINVALPKTVHRPLPPL